MHETGTYPTIREMAAAEKISETYVGRGLQPTLLAPNIVEAVLTGKQAAELQLDAMTRSTLLKG